MKEVNWGIIHREGTIECSCDMCCNTYDYEFDGGYPDFKDCQAELRSDGWISRKIDGEWMDFCCEECYNAYMEDV